MTLPSRSRRLLVGGVAALLLLLLAFFLLGRRSGDAPHAVDEASVATSGSSSSSVDDGARRARLARILALRQKLRPGLPSLVLAGKVVDGKGAPVAGATVALAVPARKLVSGPDGTFAFAELPPGRYHVEAREGSHLGGPVQVNLRAGTPPVTVRLYRALAAEIEVVTAAGHRPVAGAEVMLRPSTMFENAGYHQGRTGADGKVRFEGVALIGSELLVSAPGFAAAFEGPSFEDREGDVWHHRVELTTGDSVEGKVVDEQGKPVAGAVIDAIPYLHQYDDTPEDEDRLARTFGAVDVHTVRRRRLGPVTGADGTFRLSLQKDSPIWVIVASHQQRVAVSSEPVYAAGKGESHRVELVMPRGNRAAGFVVRGDAEPVPGALVQIRWQAGGILEKTIQADGTGRFETAGLPPAPLELIAQADGGSSRPLRLDFSTPRAEHDELVLSLENDGVIEGLVVDPRGAPVADVVVSYMEMTERQEDLGVYPAVETTGEDGRFRIVGVSRAARYHLSAVRPQDGDFTVREGYTEAKAGDQVRITIPDDGAIVGRVVIDGGRSPAGLVVADPQAMITTRVDRSGRFRLGGLPPRQYSLRVSGPSVADAYVSGVIVRSGEETDVGEVKVMAGRRIAGRVTLAGEPIDGANVRITVGGEYGLTALTDAQGRFQAVAPDGESLIVQARTDRGDSAAAELPPGQRAESLELPLLVGGLVSGVVRENGLPATDRPVLAWRAGRRLAEPTRMVVLDGAGGFRMENLPPGDWDIEVLYTIDGRKVKLYRQTVTVTSGSKTQLAYDISAGLAGGIEDPSPDEKELPLHESSLGTPGHAH